jgi:hypothetical protein
VELHRDPGSVVSAQERAEDTEHYWLCAQVPSPVWEITEAARLEGYDCLGIELSPYYAGIAEGREKRAHILRGG